MNAFKETIIHKSNDDYGEVLIKEEGMIRTLYFGNDNKQSCVFMPDPSVLILQYAQAMTASLLFNPEPKRILMVGLGGGSLVQFFMKACPNARVDVLELRESVIRLSHEYFQVPATQKKLNIIETDAKEYILSQAIKKSQEYDLILIDAFDAWGPAQLNNEDNFILSCQTLLKLDGVICFNLWNRKQDAFQHMSSHLSQLFSENILELRLGKQDSNVIVFGFSNSEKIRSIGHCQRHVFPLKEQFGIDYVRFFNMLEVQNYSTLKRRALS